jgi:hypothetical protein
VFHRNPDTKNFSCPCLNFTSIDPEKLRVSSLSTYQSPHSWRIYRPMSSLVQLLKMHQHYRYRTFPTTTTIAFLMCIRSPPHPNLIYPPSTSLSIRS